MQSECCVHHHLYAYYQPIYENDAISCLPKNQPHLFVAGNSLALISDSSVKNIKQRNFKVDIILTAVKLYNSSTQYNFHFAHSKKTTPPHFTPRAQCAQLSSWKVLFGRGREARDLSARNISKATRIPGGTLKLKVQLSLVK